MPGNQPVAPARFSARAVDARAGRLEFFTDLSSVAASLEASFQSAAWHAARALSTLTLPNSATLAKAPQDGSNCKRRRGRLCLSLGTTKSRCPQGSPRRLKQPL